jgi:tellurite resistance protein
MHSMEIEPSAVELTLRAMRAVAGADGTLAPQEADLIAQAARLLGRGAIEVEALAALEPGELRDAGLDARDAERVVQAAILVALMDGRVDAAEVRAVRALAEAAGIDEPRVRSLSLLAEGHTRLMWLDLARRSFAREVFEKALRREGWRGIWKIVGPMIGRATDWELAARYSALGELPHETLGYAYFRYIVDNGFGFPGEPNAVPESGLWHDIAHVLGGYGTTPREELQVVSFIAGFSRQDPFFWLFTITLQFHLGIQVSPYAAPERGLFDPEETVRALERGAAVSVDLSLGTWDPWPHFPRPLEEVRRELNVPPR